MKPMIRILFILLLFTVTGNAQAPFVPAGAEWYFGMGYGAFHYQTNGDTVIQGITATRISSTTLTREPWFSQGLQVRDHGDIYLYSTQDTVFRYNNHLGRFTPLFIFNLSEGDTVCLPNFSPGITPTDSLFCFTIDSIRTLLYDTAHLRTLFTRGVAIPGGGYLLNWGPNDTFGAYAERIGGIYTGFALNCFDCPAAMDASMQPAGPVRCYKDTEYSIQLVSGPCDYEGKSRSVLQSAGVDYSIRISPLPANDVLNITTAGTAPVAGIRVISMEGKEVLSIPGPATSIPVRQLAEGIYLVRILFGDGTQYVQRVLRAGY